jgi:iron complex outermembrane receptor protein
MRRPDSGFIIVSCSVLLLFLMADVCPHAVAADDEETVETKVDEKVLVTSTRLDDVDVPKSDVAAHVTIIDRDQIEASGARNLQDLLTEHTGVVLLDQVGNDVQKTLDLRGFSGGEGIAVFVDGTRINDTRNNLASLEQVPLDAVERVEVTRGPSAALAGGGAEAGVIRVITRQGTQPTASVSASGGTWDTARLDATYGGHSGRYDLFVSGAYDTTNGFRPNSGGDQKRFDVSGGVDLGEGRRLGLVLLSSSLDYGAPGALTLAEFDADPWQNTYNLLDNSNMVQRQASLTFQGPVGGGFSIAATLAYRSEDAQTLTTGRSAALFGGFYLDADGGTWSGVAQGVREITSSHGSHLIAFGLELQAGSTDSLGYFTLPTSPGSYDPAAPNSRNDSGATNSGLFAQDNWTISPRWGVTIGVRADRSRTSYSETIPATTNGNKTFSEISFHAGATMHATQSLDLFVSYGDGFLPPTPEQLYAFPTFGSNPDLEPEDAQAYEFGVRSRGRLGSLDAALFVTDTKNEIVFDPTPTATDPFGRNVNAGTTQRRGVELSGRGQLGRGVATFARVTYTDSVFTSGADEGDEVPLVPNWRVAAGIDASLPKGFGIRADALYVGSQVLDNDASNSQPRLAAYSVVNLRAGWERSLGSGASSRKGVLGLFVAAENLFDQIYATRGIYAFDFAASASAEFVTPAPGRRYLAGLTWRM